MESLGLQTVTLSDGTTAYVQQAVRGECGQGRQDPVPQSPPGASCPALLPARPHPGWRVWEGLVCI